MKVKDIIFYISWLCIGQLPLQLTAQKTAPKPLLSDPVHDGAADPVVIWNKEAKQWWMFYTNRRATNSSDTVGVRWVHGTRIGIAISKDGMNWKYKDTANINYRPDAGYTFWAPDVIEDKGIYHMYLTYVPGTFDDWSLAREHVGFARHFDVVGNSLYILSRKAAVSCASRG